MINILKIDENNNVLTWDTKLLIKDSVRNRKSGKVYHNIFYMGSLPKPILDLIQPQENIIYFYQQDDKNYLTAIKPENTNYETIKIQKVNRHYSLPKRYFNLHNDNKIIRLILNLNIYRKNKSIEIIII